jgi:hypothetical protein
VEHAAWLITRSFSLQTNQTYAPAWEQTITLPFAFEQCQRDNVLLLFEIIEIIRDSIYYRVCWGFLVTAPTATRLLHSSSAIAPVLRLQLYRFKPPSRFASLFINSAVATSANISRKQLRNLWGDFEQDSSLEVPHVYHIWALTNRLSNVSTNANSIIDENKRRAKYPATLYVTVTGSKQLFAASTPSSVPSMNTTQQLRPSTPHANARRTPTFDDVPSQLLTHTQQLQKFDSGPR